MASKTPKRATNKKPRLLKKHLPAALDPKFNAHIVRGSLGGKYDDDSQDGMNANGGDR